MKTMLVFAILLIIVVVIGTGLIYKSGYHDGIRKTVDVLCTDRPDACEDIINNWPNKQSI